MNAFVSKEELALLPANRISFPEHYADAQSQNRKPGIVARIRAWLDRQTVLAELSTLSERELADIGLSRAELPRVFDPVFARRR
ncbi:DUF1127 domain-containing protein [Acidisphaera sp. L21]|uniref:DUF1127 domain-containing protein n=1 Tax=Acidisphaera sp. L21 TaxID=1641851 RepID=UPI00131EC62B|nr:DUF1127 domain-containing protein [Acidisphaera sp. L21]